MTLLYLTKCRKAPSSTSQASPYTTLLSSVQKILNVNLGQWETKYPEIKELWRQFNEWAADVAVFAELRASLDARLAPYVKTRDMILELLDMIRENLEWSNFRA